MKEIKVLVSGAAKGPLCSVVLAACETGIPKPNDCV